MKNGMKKFMLLWAGELVSAIGSGLTSFGLGVYVFNLTGSATQMALVTLLGFLPGLLLSIPAGVLADKLDRRLLLILGDGLSGAGIVFILVSMLLGKCELWNIYVGVTISSGFASLMLPAFNATITDLLGKEEYTKASGLVSIAGSSKFLISPILAGLLLSVADIKLLLIIDICTFVLTVLVTIIVRKGMKATPKEDSEPMKSFIKEGFKTIGANKGILALVIVASLINMFMGCIQVLSESLVLGFADAATLGIAETICASGMLVASLIVGAIGIKKKQSLVLAISLSLSGIAMALFGAFQNIYLICVFGFMFFLTLPFANTCLDYLVRSNVDDKVQGRVWGIIGFISQIGSVISFALSGIIADAINQNTTMGISKASGIVILVGGVIMSLIAVSFFFLKSVKKLEKPIVEEKELTIK